MCQIEIPVTKHLFSRNLDFILFSSFDGFVYSSFWIWTFDYCW